MVYGIKYIYLDIPHLYQYPYIYKSLFFRVALYLYDHAYILVESTYISLRL